MTLFHLNTYATKFDIVAKKSRSTLGIVYINFVKREFPMLYVTSSTRSGEEDFKTFDHIWSWRPPWSCPLDHLYKPSSALPMEAPHEALIGKAVFEKKICKNG